MKRSATVLASPFLLALAGSLAAQQAVPPERLPEVRGGTGSEPVERVVHVVFDAHAGKVKSLRVGSPSEIALGNPPCYDNSIIHLPVDPQYIVANPGEELLNWGTKNCPGASRLRSFTIAYRSEAVDTSLGGPGAVFGLALFSGTAGFGNPGTEVYRATFTGQPSNGALPSGTVVYEYQGNPFLTGPAPLVLFTVDFGIDPLPLGDGPFGWSFLQLDGDTGPVSVDAPRPILGTRDAMDIYSPGPAVPGSYVGTFNYGGCSSAATPPCANMFVQLDEIANNETANVAVLNGSGTNPVLLEQIFPARLGRLWAVRVNVIAPPYPNPDFTILFLSNAAAAGPIATPYGEFLIDPAQFVRQPLLGEGSYTFPIPADTGLIGRLVFAQAIVLAPATPSGRLTNALRIRVGY